MGLGTLVCGRSETIFLKVRSVFGGLLSVSLTQQVTFMELNKCVSISYKIAIKCQLAGQSSQGGNVRRLMFKVIYLDVGRPCGLVCQSIDWLLPEPVSGQQVSSLAGRWLPSGELS